MNAFGNCGHCNGELSPVWFIEKEEIIEKGHIYETGRKRQACSHLVCDICGKKECVDDSFDFRWTF